MLVRDYTYGEDAINFNVELPKWRYDFLFVSGAANGEFFTRIKLDGIEMV